MEDKKKIEPMAVAYRCLECGEFFTETQGSRARFCLVCRDKRKKRGKKGEK